MQNVERAAKMLNDIVEEVFSEMFVSNSVAYVTEDEPDLKQAEAIRTAVMKRIEFLDANFLGALSGYEQALRAQGNSEVSQVSTS